MNRAQLAAGVVLLVLLLAIGLVGGTNVVDLDGDQHPALLELVDGTEALRADSDGDGLDDGREAELGTDPWETDTDTDGLSDRYEAADSGPLADADPLRRDIFVELDYMAGEKPGPTVMRSVKEAFADAPITNPDGTTGITLHVTLDDELPRDSPTSPLGLDAMVVDHFDHRNQGYHYAVAVENATTTDGTDVVGLTDTSDANRPFMFQTDESDVENVWPRNQASMFMHELGHSIGLTPEVYRGIDSYEVSYETYESVMNYNSEYWKPTYSSEAPFDDWAYLESNLTAPVVLPEAMNTTKTGR